MKGTRNTRSDRDKLEQQHSTHGGQHDFFRKVDGRIPAPASVRKKSMTSIRALCAKHCEQVGKSNDTSGMSNFYVYTSADAASEIDARIDATDFEWALPKGAENTVEFRAIQIYQREKGKSPKEKFANAYLWLEQRKDIDDVEKVRLLDMIASKALEDADRSSLSGLNALIDEYRRKIRRRPLPVSPTPA